MPAQKSLILDFDDLHWKYPENCLDTIGLLVNRFPNIKLSFFAVAKHSGLPISQNKEWCDSIRKYIESGNVCLGIHGLFHSTLEFKNKSYDDAIKSLLEAEKEFKDAELQFLKIFKGPHWGINPEVYKALISLGYSHVYSHEEYKILGCLFSEHIKTIYYNWNLKDDDVSNEDLIIGHGHTHNVCDNGIKQTADRIISFLSKNEIQHKFLNET